MSGRMPVVFVSHGAPDALLKASDAVDCWRTLGRQIPRPAAILIVSSHWEAAQPTASLSDGPKTIHDFSGFAPELHRMQYPAPGAPALSQQAVALLTAAGIAAGFHPDRGLDHGAWAPLSAMYPKANVPVAQLSLISHQGAAAHLALGQALAPLRDENVLIVTSGAITHNFAWLDRQADDAAPVPQAQMFTVWVAAQVTAQNIPALLAYRSAPHGQDAHPTEEHFLPFFVALGAAGSDTAQRYRPHFSYGGLAMDAYVWRDGVGL